MVRQRPGEVVPVPEKRGLNRVEAAGYIGIGVTLFDKLVAEGRMPRAKRIEGRYVWDRRQLDKAFDALPEDEPASDLWGEASV